MMPLPDRLATSRVARSQVAATPVTSTSFVFKPNALEPGATYRFALYASDPGGTSFAEVEVPVSTAPHGLGGPGTLGALSAAATGGPGNGTQASPGVAFATVFRLAAAGWAEQDDGPLLYQFQYVVLGQQQAADGGGGGGGGAPAPVVLAKFQPGKTLSGVTLPAGLDAAGNIVQLQL